MSATTLLHLALASLRYRRRILLLVLLTLTLSLTLLLGVQYLRQEARQSFLNTISGTDLIVGARSGPINLLLYSVFHLGDPTNNLSWKTASQLMTEKGVSWSVPLSLGDSYKGYRVVGTSEAFLAHVRTGQRQPLQLAQGAWFKDLFEVVLGAEVARAKGHSSGDLLTLAHGGGATSFLNHADKPFRVSGILAPTGTPIDRAVYVSLAGLEAIHLGWATGVPAAGNKITAEQARMQDLTPKTITALLIGVERKVMTFQLQRRWNDWQEEALSAILPGVTLASLWQTLGIFEQVMLGISALVVLASLIGMLAVLLVIQSTRQREMQLLRASGASPGLIAGLFVTESVLLSILAVLGALALWYGGLYVLAPSLQSHWGVHIALRWPNAIESGLLGSAPLLAALIALSPAIRDWRKSRSTGLD